MKLNELIEILRILNGSQSFSELHADVVELALKKIKEELMKENLGK